MFKIDTLKAILQRIRSPKPKPTDEDKAKAKEEAFKKAARIRSMMDHPGWLDYIGLIDEKIENDLFNKLNTALFLVSPEEIDRLRLRDYGIHVMKTLKNLPMDYYRKIEEGGKKDAKNE